MQVNDEEYQKHTVFADLERYADFYKTLAHSVFGFVSGGTRGNWNIDSYVLSSIQGTLASIHAILRDGRINDAYALLRKYYDSAIINIYTNLYLQEQSGWKNLIVTQIDSWLQGTHRLPEFGDMFRYIRDSERVAPITSLLLADNRYRQLRDRCNDHTHYNFFANVLLNDSELYLRERQEALEEFSTDLRDVLILHLSYLFFANGHYMTSSDYIDYLECGMTPVPESQYWVAPFVQRLFDQTIRQYRPDIVAKIRDHSSMHLK